MHTLLKTLGIVTWTGCVITLLYQSVVWILTATWPSITLMTILSDILGIDIIDLFQHCSISLAIKLTYFLTTTELAITLWWAGVLLFAAAVCSKVLLGK